MLQILEVFSTQPIQHAAPELAVAADVVVAVGRKLTAIGVEPDFARLIPQLPPDRVRVPVLVFLWNEVAALDDQDPRRRLRQRVGECPTAGAAADNDDVVSLLPHHRAGTATAAGCAADA